MMPIVSSDAASAQPVSGQADVPTVPRRVVQGAAVAGAARASSQNLQPRFDADDAAASD